MQLRCQHIIALLFALVFMGKNIAELKITLGAQIAWNVKGEIPVNESERTQAETELEVKEVLVPETVQSPCAGLRWQELSSRYPPYILAGYNDHTERVLTPPPQSPII
jgi:hypothetical protein